MGVSIREKKIIINRTERHKQKSDQIRKITNQSGCRLSMRIGFEMFYFFSFLLCLK